MGYLYRCFGMNEALECSPNYPHTRSSIVTRSHVRNSDFRLSCLTLRVSHRAWIEPGEWLNTKPSTSPRGATPTHAGRWGSAWRTPPDLQTTEATGFSPKPDRLQAGDRIGDWRLAGCPGAKNRYAERPTQGRPEDTRRHIETHNLQLTPITHKEPRPP